MKVTIEHVENGFLLEVDVYTYTGFQSYTYNVIKSGTKRIICPTLLAVFQELNKVFPHA